MRTVAPKLILRVLQIAALAILSGLLPVYADVPYYTISLQWSKNSLYQLDVRNSLGTQTGITITPVLEFQGNYRQTVVVVPELASCIEDTALLLAIDALQATQEAYLIITSVNQVIYQQSIDHSITARLPALDPQSCHRTPDAIVGEVTLAVAKPFNEATLTLENFVKFDVGHAWIEFRALSLSIPVAFATIGTYNSAVGDNVLTGINFFREISKKADARKTIKINQQQLDRLIAVINQYQAMGPASWTTWHNCTAFAIDAWQSVSGETLSATLIYKNAPWEVTQLGLPNSTSLYYSLLAAGGFDSSESMLLN